jgi:EAL domain-containing protein (putative c-di-GMP-specific phosphodiesterase class I)
VNPSSHRKVFEPGAEIFSEGDEGDYVYFIHRGKVELSTMSGGARKVITTLAEGDVLGEMALVDKKPRTATAIALSRVELLASHRDFLEAKLAHTDPMVSLFIRVIMERYRSILRGGKDTTSPSDAEPKSYLDQLVQTTARIEVDLGLNEALSRQELRLAYQPIVNLETRRIVGCESLIRWQHPDRGLIGPGAFLSTAEDTGTIIPISRWIVQQACSDLQLLEAARARNPLARNLPPLYMSINLSGRQFEDPHLAEDIHGLVLGVGADPRRIKLEITESLLIESPDRAARILNAFRDYGFSIAIDDFGTGYSSFNYLCQYPIDTLKVDRSFVLSMRQDHRSSKIVHALIIMANSLDMTVIAEGIEHEDEASRLLDFGAENGQGYLFSRPVPLETLSDVLENEPIREGDSQGPAKSDGS